MTLALQLRSRESTPQLLVRTLARALAMPPAESEVEGELEERVRPPVCCFTWGGWGGVRGTAYDLRGIGDITDTVRYKMLDAVCGRFTKGLLLYAI